MKRVKKSLFIFILILTIVLLCVWWRAPLICNEWSKQTLYVGLLDTWYGFSTDDKAYAIWIDDDSSKGVFTVKTIADEIGIQPAFAVIANKMTPIQKITQFWKIVLIIYFGKLSHETIKNSYLKSIFPNPFI